MFRHYLIAALRNMAANRLQTAIAIAGLALGLTAAILAALVVRNQLTYDSFLPGHERLYVAGVDVEQGGRATEHLPYAPHSEAAKLASLAGVEAVSRTGINFEGHSFRNGRIEGADSINEGDPAIFDLLQLTTLYGDLRTALARPDAIVIPLTTARKYFGIDNAVGQILILDGKHALRVAAVVADLPFHGSNLRSAIFVSDKAAWTDLAKADSGGPGGINDFIVDSQTFVRLAPGVSSNSVEARMRTMIDYLLPHPPGVKLQARLIPLAALSTNPDYAPGVLEKMAAFTAVGLVILALSVINFVNLTTAGAARRNTEVGTRKALGAGRGDLMRQFLGEAVLQTLAALLLALAAVEWLAPMVNTVLDTGASLDYSRDGVALLALLLGALLVGLVAGFYPALVLSSFRPALVLKSGPLGAERGALVRQLLVILQFCVLVMLGIGAGVFVMQYHFALSRTFARADRVLFVQVPKCDGEFKDKVAALPGVAAIACTDISFIRKVPASTSVKLPNGGTIALDTVTAGPGLLEMFGQKPIAGHGLMAADESSEEPKAGDPPVHILVNQMALRKLGITSPGSAVGHVVRLVGVPVPVVIVGVVRDFSAYALDEVVGPTAYIYRDVPSLSPLVTLRLDGDNNRAVLAAVNENWSKSGGGGPLQSIFLKDWISRQRLSLLYEGEALSGFAGIALLLGCLGLFGISVAAAERRIKEVGVRKAMGARHLDILGLLLWQFARPVLWANLIAWPLAWWAMTSWLDGFAYHVAMPLWLFPAVGVGTLLIALLTVTGQARLVTRQKPVLALRYE